MLVHQRLVNYESMLGTWQVHGRLHLADFFWMAGEFTCFGGLLCSTNTAHRCHIVFGSYLLHFLHFLPRSIPNNFQHAFLEARSMDPTFRQTLVVIVPSSEMVQQASDTAVPCCTLFPSISYDGWICWDGLVKGRLDFSEELPHFAHNNISAARSKRITQSSFEPGRDRVVVGILETDSILGFGKFQGAISMGRNMEKLQRKKADGAERIEAAKKLKCPVSDFSSLPSSEVPSVNLNSSLVICPLPEALTGGKYQLLPQLQPSMNFRTLEECSMSKVQEAPAAPVESWSTMPLSMEPRPNEADDSLQGGVPSCLKRSVHMQHNVIILPTFAPEIHFQSKIHVTVIHSLFILLVRKSECSPNQFCW